MSNKISVLEILKGNFSTLYNVEKGRRDYMDIATFYGLPLSVAILSIYNNYALSDKLIGHLITASALLSGLLLNLSVVISSLKNKLSVPKIDDEDYAQRTLKRTIVQELFFNVSSASLCSFFLLAFCILQALIGNSSIINIVVINPIISFLGVHLLMSFLMVTKRIYRLLLNL